MFSGRLSNFQTRDTRLNPLPLSIIPHILSVNLHYTLWELSPCAQIHVSNFKKKKNCICFRFSSGLDFCFFVFLFLGFLHTVEFPGRFLFLTRSVIIFLAHRDTRCLVGVTCTFCLCSLPRYILTLVFSPNTIEMRTDLFSRAKLFKNRKVPLNTIIFRFFPFRCRDSIVQTFMPQMIFKIHQINHS